MATRGRVAIWAWLPVAGALLACRGPNLVLAPVPSGAEGISLLGDTLWAAPIDQGMGPTLVQSLHAAQRILATKPTDQSARILVARRTAALGRIREAIALYTAIIADRDARARVYRRRGEMLLLIRELDLAERDLRKAAKDPVVLIEREFSDAPASSLVGSRIRYQIELLLGVIRYVRGDFSKASDHLVEALQVSDGADELAQSGLWLVLALRRAGRTADAAAVLRGIPSDLDVKDRVPELTLVRLFKGEASLDSVQSRLAARRMGEEALYLYGLGFAQLSRGDRDGAREMFEETIRIGPWTAWPVIAAEAEVARLRRPGPPR